MPSTNCYSCGMPLGADTKGKSDNYCLYCTDEQGNLKSREQVQSGIAQWFRQWQPEIDDTVSMTRAQAYMQAMPAWA